MQRKPQKRNRPARRTRQVYGDEYITTSFGDVPKHDIWEGLKCFVIFMAALEGTLLFMGKVVFGW